MKKMKQWLAIMSVGALVVGMLSGCGETEKSNNVSAVSEDNSSDDKDNAEGVKTVTINDYEFEVDTTKDPGDIEIALVYANVTTPFAQYLKKGIEDYAAETGINAYMTAPDTWSTENEIEMIENLIAKGVDGLAVMVLDQDAMTPIINRALEAGIPTICWNVDDVYSDRLGFIGEDLYLAGENTARALVEKMGEKGKVLITSEDASTYHSQQREQGARDYLAKYPDIEIMETLDCQGADDQGMYAAIEQIMQANDDINGVISAGGTCYILSNYLRDNNIGNNFGDAPIWNTGHDLREEKVQDILDGWSTAQFGQNPYEQGYGAAKMLGSFLTTGDSSSFQVVDTGLLEVDADNAQEIMERILAGEIIG